MSVHVLSWALSQVKQGHRVAIATIVSAKGSVPGTRCETGNKFKMQNFGTVGGAGLELKIEKLIELLKEDHKLIRRVVGR